MTADPNTEDSALNRGIVVFSGGSAANSLVDAFNTVRANKQCLLNYVIPISDNGGSTSELIRIFGGPGIGDVRSRLVRLIPDSAPDSERAAVKALFNHRLDADATAARENWQSIVDGTSPLWSAITPAKKELIRSFFNYLNLEILKRARPPTSTFDFSSASVGNLFLTGARLFTGSFESAIHLLGSIGGVSSDLVRVIPAINSNFSHHISASLEDGSVIVGQNSISHPSNAPGSPKLSRRRASLLLADGDANDSDYLDMDDATSYQDDHIPGSLPSLRHKNITFNKADTEELPSRISRIWYINPYGQEIRPPANPRVLEAINDSQAIIYSIGSLYTSIIPSLILRGVGKAIAMSPARHKILILNGSLDRETGPATKPFTAVDFVEAIVKAGEESRGRGGAVANIGRDGGRPRSMDAVMSSLPSSSIATNLLITPESTLPSIIEPSSSSLEGKKPLPYTSYVTHILHLEGPGTPTVDRERLSAMGIETLRLYGRKVFSNDGAVLGMRYDSTALVQALEVVLGKKGDAMVRGKLGGGVSRRNTLEGGFKER
ncbi:hypothetical protein TMatcc_005496 [Talaromyces marneffei ATCC 18224]|uniref:UPF0052 domain protein n=1 Tax=Talaromyces marneffei (strain ATCC 18224 / CBS 334.59 / QM 7333) TaxID=441960 RepID=B6QAF1_TALMQ|nr:uncharacterized protein EYB26_005965 [Talaromyces marneffei]EEA26247.1 UPF0052 domain protein [Talaromyces marneffei ATCC 18224]KAE8554943.1 hypothetical protein EYB25_003490 [Talaromyces marneffei]QGA18281.1 hypothetical protein EYB26_005965 [Talaromyces marneffei]